MRYGTARQDRGASPRRGSGDTILYEIEDRLYLNITDRCTLTCDFCPKTRGSHRVHEYDLSLHARPEPDVVIGRIGDPRRYAEVVFCGYGEPTLRLKPLIQIASHVKVLGGRVRVNTDGLANLVHKRNVLAELARCVDALSVSMNAQDEDSYVRHCHPALKGAWQGMLDFLDLAPHHIADVTATAIDGLEGVDIDACARLAAARGVKFRARHLDVVG